MYFLIAGREKLTLELNHPWEQARPKTLPDRNDSKQNRIFDTKLKISAVIETNLQLANR